jgi:hypothetical protein
MDHAMKLIRPDPFEDADEDDASGLISGCGLLACIVLFAMFALIIWRAMQ